MATNNQLIIGVVGAGAMGSGIAQVAATYGHKTILFDTSQAAIEKAKIAIDFNLNKLIEKQKITAEQKVNIANCMHYVSDVKQLAPCNLIIEAIIEDLAIKQKVFIELESIVSNECVLASNTSSLSITSIASACKNANRVIGIHFFNPAYIMPLVEVIPAIQTAENITQLANTLITSWKKSTVIAKDLPGFIVNRIARPYYGEAIRIFEEGIADFATIDYAMRNYGGFKMGPFELMDFIGNDINYKVTETVWEQFFYEPRFKPSFTQKRLYEAKLYGKKVGKGYYDYTKILPEPNTNELIVKKIYTRILCMLINEAVDSLYLNLASASDIDIAMTKGVNYPKGLLAWCDEIGANVILANIEELYELYGEDRYRPSVLLKRLAQQQKKIFE